MSNELSPTEPNSEEPSNSYSEPQKLGDILTNDTARVLDVVGDRQQEIKAQEAALRAQLDEMIAQHDLLARQYSNNLDGFPSEQWEELNNNIMRIKQAILDLHIPPGTPE